MENLYKNFIKLNIMSNLNFENIVGFKAVDKDGNEQNVTVDEMVDMVSTRMVMALSETSTFAAAAATGNDVYENELPTVTDAANVRVLQSSGDAAKMTMQSLASKLGELFTNLKLFPFMYRGRVSDANLAVDNGWYEIFGDISNAPFTQSWGPLFVIGHSYKVQFAFYSVSDGFKLYVRQLNHTNFGWNKIDLTQV